MIDQGCIQYLSSYNEWRTSVQRLTTLHESVTTNRVTSFNVLENFWVKFLF